MSLSNDHGTEELSLVDKVNCNIRDDLVSVHCIVGFECFKEDLIPLLRTSIVNMTLFNLFLHESSLIYWEQLVNIWLWCFREIECFRTLRGLHHCSCEALPFLGVR